MATALFLHAADAPGVDVLKRAFEASGELTSVDAQQAVRRPGGVLATGIDEEAARAVARRLREMGIGAEAVDGAWLGLPRARTCRCAKAGLTGLVVFDAHDTPTTIPWSEVLGVSAGVLGGTRPMGPSLDPDYRVRTTDDLVLEVVSGQPLRRYHIRCNGFRYEGKSSGGSRANLLRLLREIVAHAENPAISIGARSLIDDPDTTLRYDTKSDLEHEMAWQLWRHHGPGRSVDGERGRDSPFVPTSDHEDRSFVERARAHAADRVMDDNVAFYAQHMKATQGFDAAMAALLGLLTTIYLMWRFELGEGALGLVYFVPLWPLASTAWFFSLRLYRGRRTWIG